MQFLSDLNIGFVCISLSVILLLIMGAIVFIRKELPPFKTVLINGSVGQIKAYLETGNIDLNMYDEFGITPLMIAASYNKNFKVTELLIKKGASVLSRDNEGYTALFHAIRNKAPYKTMELLIKRGADLYDRTADGFTALTVALKNEPTSDLLIWLINHGLDVNERDRNVLAAEQSQLRINQRTS